jgi:uncharacterized protein (DUF305 family)
MTKVAIGLALLATAAFGFAAFAMEATNPATQAYEQAMSKMDSAMRGMTPSNDASVDFVTMMRPHHQAAIDMAEAYLKYGKDPELLRMTKNIISSQTKEIKEMNEWEAKHGM